MYYAGSTSNIQAGEEMTLRDLMYCAMLGSANEACNIIAVHISGSLDAFVSLMNERAAELGCTGTHFNNTHGLPDSDHYTTARDFTMITCEAMAHDLFVEISGTVSYTVPATNMSGERRLSNTNGLINPESSTYPGYYYEYARAGKTGHTTGRRLLPGLHGRARRHKACLRSAGRRLPAEQRRQHRLHQLLRFPPALQLGVRKLQHPGSAEHHGDSNACPGQSGR